MLAANEGMPKGVALLDTPDIDSVVYLTDCDPSAFEAGDLIRARIVTARGYDLVAAPLINYQ